MSVTAVGSYATKHRGAIGLGLALVSAASFGTAGSFADSLLSQGWSSGAVVTIRISLAALVLTPPALLQMRGRWRLLRAKLGTVALYGILAVAGCQLFFFNAVERLDVGVALLLEYMGIVLVVLYVWARTRRRPRWLTLAGVVTAIGGLVLVLNPSGGLDLVGVIWGLLAGTGLATYFVISSRTDDALPPLVVAWSGMVVGALTFGAFALVGVLPMHATNVSVELFGQQVSWLVPVLGLSVIAAALSYSTGVGAARLLGATVASFVGLTEVLFAVLFAALLVGQVPSVPQLVGGLVVLVGVAVVRATDTQADATREPDPALVSA
ncbi:EamA family transporter [Cryptosporangium phraense]|uniref:EamA family transporter n=1 Tax=Cryptosporangium phraense TaxID=2593070 RepID=A0A545AM23_9ACTN|nr:EamA family transporter [Cryptosporangium phraense]TQS42369.1 EamA family transporter [Cryptosporangium phraense]